MLNLLLMMPKNHGLSIRNLTMCTPVKWWDHLQAGMPFSTQRTSTSHCQLLHRDDTDVLMERELKPGGGLNVKTLVRLPATTARTIVRRGFFNGMLRLPKRLMSLVEV